MQMAKFLLDASTHSSQGQSHCVAASEMASKNPTQVLMPWDSSHPLSMGWTCPVPSLLSVAEVRGSLLLLCHGLWIPCCSSLLGLLLTLMESFASLWIDLESLSNTKLKTNHHQSLKTQVLSAQPSGSCVLRFTWESLGISRCHCNPS